MKCLFPTSIRSLKLDWLSWDRFVKLDKWFVCRIHLKTSATCILCIKVRGPFTLSFCLERNVKFTAGFLICVLTVSISCVRNHVTANISATSINILIIYVIDVTREAILDTYFNFVKRNVYLYPILICQDIMYRNSFQEENLHPVQCREQRNRVLILISNEVSYELYSNVRKEFPILVRDFRSYEL